MTATVGYGTANAITTSFRYDPATLGVTTVSTTAPGDPNDHQQQFAYSTQGLPVTEVDGLGRTTTLTYNTFGEVLSTTTPNPSSTGPATVTATNTYDGHGNLLSASSPLYSSATAYTARKTTYAHADTSRPDLVTSTADPLGAVSTFTYDTAGDQLSATTSEGRRTTRTYDAVGRVLTTVAPQGNLPGATAPRFTTTYTYDKANRLLTETVANGSTPMKTTHTYDNDGRTTTLTDSAARKTTSVYDLGGETIQVTRADGTVLKTTYWPDGVLKSQIDAAGHITTYAEDAVGRVVATADPLGRTTRYTFDGVGNRLTSTDPAGQVTTSGYDNDNEETSRTYSSTATHGVTQSYNGAGVRTSMTDGTGTSNRAADSLGRLTSQKAAGGTVGYTYDLDGHVTKIVYPSTKSVTRTFGSDGEMTAVTDFAGAKTTFAYTPDGLLAKTLTPNGVASTNTFNDPDQLTGIVLAKGTTTLAKLSDTLNSDDEVTAETTTGLGASQTYAYNTLGQVTANNVATIGYDAADNLVKTPDGVAQTYDTANEITKRAVGATTTTYTYNKDGSRTAGAGLSYNQEQQLTGYTASTMTATYTYDGDGLRQTKTVGTAASTFAYDTAEGLPLILTDGANNYIYGPTGTPIEQITATTSIPSYLHTDHLGSVRLITNATGTATGTANYTPYGNRVTTGSTSPFSFAGQYQDTETGLIWMRARYYDPATGQFITSDPLKAATRSAYNYSLDNPVNGTDPSGLVDSGTIKTLKYLQNSAGQVSAVASVCDLTVVAAPECGTVGALASVVGVGSSLALYYYCHEPSDLLNAVTSVGFTGLTVLANNEAKGAEYVVNALHARAADKLEAAQQILTKDISSAVDAGYAIYSNAQSFSDRFNRGVGKIQSLF